MKKDRAAPAKTSQPSSGKGGPSKHDGRDRIRPGTFDEKRSPAFEGPSVVLKDEP